VWHAGEPRGGALSARFFRGHPAAIWALSWSLSLAAHLGLLYLVWHPGANKQAPAQPIRLTLQLQQPSAPAAVTATPGQGAAPSEVMQQAPPALLSAMPDAPVSAPKRLSAAPMAAPPRIPSAPPEGSEQAPDLLQVGAQDSAGGAKNSTGFWGQSARGHGAYGTVDRMPQKLSACLATYPEAARQQKLTGKVVLNVEVGSDGQVGDIVVVSGLGLGLTDAAVSAVKTCRFSPAQRQGTAIPSRIKYVYTFVLQD
jgi:protein TonB